MPYDVRKFIIYVNDKVGFWCNFEALETSWKGTADNITKVAVDKDDPYFASLLAACIISHVSGISRKHLTGDNKVITSIARYYIYYHMKRFTEDPRKMNSYITSDIQELIKTNLQTKTTWVNKFVHTLENISLWYQQHPNKHNIRNYKYRMSRNHTGVLGITFSKVSQNRISCPRVQILSPAMTNVNIGYLLLLEVDRMLAAYQPSSFPTSGP